MTKLLSAAQAAAELGVTPQHIRQLAADGRIKGARRMGRDWFMPAPVRVSKVPRGRPKC